ncbi:MAG: BppU family phage baseplate upper protein [Bacteroidales bacterium]|nr:BppU family phage baseplate upper protein [Bacteroidales bacterium]
METYNFKPHVKGDTFKGCRFTVNVNNAPLNLTGCQIRMHLRTNPLHDSKYELSTINGKIVIIDTINGIFEIPEQIIDIPAGNYYYDIEITFPDGKVKTYINGRFEIVQDITY